jgi:MoaA/NifB/PqqE/SkfB family radical SAM enzyme
MKFPQGVGIGFSLTQHCNLRCAHCIRDDITTFAELDIGAILRFLEDARSHLGAVVAGFTGGEPMLHRQWPELVAGLRGLDVPYTIVSNGWHMARFAPVLDLYPPAAVRLSLSGADEATHDAERGRGSFMRIMLATAVLTSREVPTSYAMIVDRRTRHQIGDAIEFARSMGVLQVRFTLPQPVPASLQRGTDLSPAEARTLRAEVDALAAPLRGRIGEPSVVVDYGAPSDMELPICSSMAMGRIYVDVHGRLSTCCQLSEYGSVESDVVAHMDSAPFPELWAEQRRRTAELQQLSASRGDDDPLRDFPCLRCARATGKMDWVRNFPDSPWQAAADATPLPVTLTYSPRARRLVAAS